MFSSFFPEASRLLSSCSTFSAAFPHHGSGNSTTFTLFGRVYHRGTSPLRSSWRYPTCRFALKHHVISCYIIFGEALYSGKWMGMDGNGWWFPENSKETPRNIGFTQVASTCENGIRYHPKNAKLQWNKTHALKTLQHVNTTREYHSQQSTSLTSWRWKPPSSEARCGCCKFLAVCCGILKKSNCLRQRMVKGWECFLMICNVKRS